MDAEHERAIGRLREIVALKSKRFEITIGGRIVRIDAPARVELIFSADEPLRVNRLDFRGEVGKNPE